MALVGCPECGKQVSDSALSCPDCGYAVEAHFQKLREEEKEKRRFKQENEHKEKRIKTMTMPEKPKFPKWALIVAGISGLVGVLSAILTNGDDRVESIAHGNGDPMFGSVYLIIFAIGSLILGYYFYQKQVTDYEMANRNFDKYKEVVIKREEEQEKQTKFQAEQEALLHPKCPNCRSYDTKKISNTSRVTSVVAIGLASGKIGKQYKCKKCGHMW